MSLSFANNKVKAALLTVGLFFILFAGWLKLGDIYGTSNPPPAYVVMDYLEKNDFLTLEGLKLYDLDEKEIDLENLPKNQVYIVNFWASWCEPCAQEFPSMVKLLEQHKGQLQILAISNDSDRTDIDTFAKAFKLNEQEGMKLLWDKEMKMARLFAIGKLPESFIFDKKGRLVKKIVGTREWDTPDALQYFKMLTAQ